MATTGKDVLVPPDAVWVQLTDELLASSDSADWIELARDFLPEEHGAGERMAKWLRDCVAGGSTSEDTYVIRTSKELLGFFALNEVQVRLSRRARPIFELRKRIREHELQPGLMLSCFARSRSAGRGFGHVLFDYALGAALSTPHVVAIFVQPDNLSVARMWEENYHFKPMDDPTQPGLLYFPVGTVPEANWPS